MKNVITLFMLALSLGLFAQEFSGKATYQFKRTFKDIEDGTLKDPELAKQINEAMKKASEKTFFLEFTKDESLYTEEEKLAQPSTGGHRVVAVSFSSSGSGKLYKNLKEKYSLLENDYLGKEFLIKNDSLHSFEWELTAETKQIGNYTVYKATRIVQPKSYFSDDEDEQNKEESEEKSLDLLSMIDKEPEELIYTAWYTPEIPIANGPETHGGLPGLILELHTPNEVYLCSEVVLNPKKAIKIKAPKGKVTSQKEYDDMIKERWKNAEKTKDGKGRVITTEVIQIGG